jgi:hypothetical protein
VALVNHNKKYKILIILDKILIIKKFSNFYLDGKKIAVSRDAF